MQDVLSDLDHRMLEAGRQDKLKPQSGLASTSSSRGVAKNTHKKTNRRGAPRMFIVSPHPRYGNSTHFIHRPAPNGPVHPPSTHSLGEPRAIEHDAPGPPQHGVLVSMGPEHRRSASSPSDARRVMSLTLFSSFEEEFARKCVLPREEAGP